MYVIYLIILLNILGVMIDNKRFVLYRRIPNSANFLALSLEDRRVTHFTLNRNGSSNNALATELPNSPVAPNTTTVLGPSGASVLDPHPILK